MWGSLLIFQPTFLMKFATILQTLFFPRVDIYLRIEKVASNMPFALIANKSTVLMDFGTVKLANALIAVRLLM